MLADAAPRAVRRRHQRGAAARHAALHATAGRRVVDGRIWRSGEPGRGRLSRQYSPYNNVDAGAAYPPALFLTVDRRRSRASRPCAQDGGADAEPGPSRRCSTRKPRAAMAVAAISGAKPISMRANISSCSANWRAPNRSRLRSAASPRCRARSNRPGRRSGCRELDAMDKRDGDRRRRRRSGARHVALSHACADTARSRIRRALIALHRLAQPFGKAGHITVRILWMSRQSTHNRNRYWRCS